MLTIEQLTAEPTNADLVSLVELLQNVVDDGASIGFHLPLSEKEAEYYWRNVLRGVADRTRILLVSRDTETGNIVGSAQLELATKPNAPHRAEVQKVIVHTSMRGQHLGRQLMQALEAAALSENRTLLYLDTRSGDVAEKLYANLGYIRVGAIPRYVTDEKGEFSDTIIFYKQLDG